MISSLRGTVLHAASDHVVIETGGVGFSVAVPADVAVIAGQHALDVVLATALPDP